MDLHPVWSAYVSSDPFGKLIFFALFSLSIGSWTLIGWKGWLFWQARRAHQLFQRRWGPVLDQPLALEPIPSPLTTPDLLTALYQRVRSEACLLLERNLTGQSQATLCSKDVAMIASAADSEQTQLVADLGAHLYWLSVITTLAPFLGLLGTVWGILGTFSSLGGHASSSAVLAGLGTALATTVLGLVIAIPARLGYSILHQQLDRLDLEVERFRHLLLARIEFAYRP